MDYSYLERNLSELKNKIKEAAEVAGRAAEDILLMPAVKYADADEINRLISLGITDIGENRVQQLLEHWEKIDRQKVNIHFIGSLQTNKVKYIIDKVSLIHSLDSHRLAEEINKQAKKKNIIMDVLIEINSGNEESKGGISFDEVEGFAQSLSIYENINLRGFMTMAPKCSDGAMYREYFSKTRFVSERIWTEMLHKDGKPVISMGMSNSFSEAIAEGSTLIRVGRTIFNK